MGLIDRHRIVLTLEGAKLTMAAAEAKARDIGADMAIAIVDGGANLLCLHRMDSAKITSM